MAVNEGDGVRLDIDHLVSLIKDMVPQGPLMPPTSCIFKIPVILKRHNEKAFIPVAFSIGPFHHGNPNLKATEEIKAKYLQGLISRSHFPDTMLRTMVSSIMEVEKEARECYAEAIPFKPEELVKILVIDGCFLIELFRKKVQQEPIKEDDPIFSRSCMTTFLYYDLILLENQVPWMVLEILFNLTKDSCSAIPLIRLATAFFDLPFVSNATFPVDRVMSIKGVKHFVDLFRKLSTLSSTDPRRDLSINLEGSNHFVDLVRKLPTLSSTLFRKILSTLSSSEENQERRRIWENLPSATSLVEAGIKFKSGTSQCILDVKFNDGVLEIPPFKIDEITETLFRNLISYEHCHPNCESKFTSYAVLLNNLIITPKDMNILCENQIIDNWLTLEDVTQLFNKLYYDTSSKNYYYEDLCKQVNRFCRRHWPRWRAVFVRNYFNTPWAVLSTLAAIILLIMTLLQTVYAMKK